MDPKFGQLIEGDAARDAVHVAVTPATAAHILAPGDHVGFATEDGALGRVQPHLGIVDPFLTVAVMPGQRFWLFLYPGTITSLRHQWTHPAFSEEGLLKGSSEAWLRSFANEMGITYSEVLQACEDGEFTLGHDTPDVAYSKSGEMWRHYGIVTGKPVSDHSETPFRCAC